jgi:hypothetical protein
MLTYEQALERVRALEAYREVHEAIEAASDIEWEPGEQKLVDITVTARDDKQYITSALGLPPAVLIAGLKAMESELERMADVREPA